MFVRHEITRLVDKKRELVVAFREQVFAEDSLVQGDTTSQRNGRIVETVKDWIDTVKMDRDRTFNPVVARANWEAMDHESIFIMLLSHIDADLSGNDREEQFKQIAELAKVHAKKLNVLSGTSSLDDWTAAAHIAIRHAPSTFDTVIEDEAVGECLKTLTATKLPMQVEFARDISRMKKEYKQEMTYAHNSGIAFQDEVFSNQRPLASFIQLLRSKIFVTNAQFKALKGLGLLPPICDGRPSGSHT
jgi:hypothetical protein